MIGRLDPAFNARAARAPRAYADSLHISSFVSSYRLL